MNTLAVIGAGCSKGLADLPIDNQFMGKLEDEISCQYFLKEALNCIYFKGGVQPQNFWKEERLEVCWNEIDENYNRTKIISTSSKIDEWADKFYDLANHDKGKFKYYSYYLRESPQARTPYQYLFMFAGWELRKIAAKVYSKTLNEHEKISYLKLKEKIISLSYQDIPNFISFNYDTLLEQALENIYYLALDPKEVGKYPVLKPHGSVNWIHTNNKRISSQRTPLPIDEIGFLEGVLHQHSIIGLVFNKIEFDMDKQLELGASEVANLYGNRILNEFERMLRETEQVIIIGYSFPFADAHVRNSILRSRPINLKKVILIDKKAGNNIEKSMSAISSLLKVPSNNIDVYDDGVENWINA